MVFAQREGGGGGVVAAESRLWPVGDKAGWTFGVLEWSNYKPFRAGDVLLFRYPPGAHNVVQVDAEAVQDCEIPGNATVWSSGSDRITLARGVSFFVCGFPGHCKNGMKIAITAN
ncbi:basic blue protein-like [Phragmites australis]|uniref:basic blue protein-like n=1 Tax=Phragmites australis TaxID=29695 RepID=UPI002D770BB4|nr:basic blue protein-like [Phragmites australis]